MDHIKKYRPQVFAQGGLAITPNLEEVDQTGIDLNDYLLPRSTNTTITTYNQCPMLK